MRKPFKKTNFSVENFYYELFKNFKNNKFEIKFKICPLHSKNIFNRIILCIWAIFNQGDINHICGDINFISIFLKKKKTINTFLDCYSMKRLNGIKRFLYSLFWIKIPILKSNKIIAISKKTSEEILNYSQIDCRSKIKIIGICVSNRFKKKQKSNIGKLLNILIVGTSINKNINNIFYSLKDINCKSTIIGYLDKTKIDKLTKLNIRFKNYVAVSDKKLINEYEKSDLLLYPSLYEGFGMPILESQSVGRVVITSKIEPMLSVAGNGAIFVNPRKISEISKAIKNVANSKKLRLSTISNGFINVKKFSKLTILREHLEIYNNQISYD